jgi:hypothetical protein
MRHLIFALFSFAFGVMSIYADTILPTTGNRCSSSTLGHVQVIPQTPPNLETAIQNFQATKEATSVSLSVEGARVTGSSVATTPTASDATELTGFKDKRAFWIVFRCNTASSAATEWVTITPTDGSTKFPSGIQTSGFLDTLSLVDDVSAEDLNTAVFYYFAISAVDSVDSPAAIASASGSPGATALAFFGDATMYQKALNELYTRAASSGYAWTRNALIAKVSFAPTQTHLVVEAGNSAFPQSGEFFSTSGAPALATTTLESSVSHTLTATSEATDFTGSPVYTWGWTMSGPASNSTTPASLDFNSSGNTLSIAGSFATTNAEPGNYSLAVTSWVTDSASSFNSSTSSVFSWTINPRPVDIDKSDGASVVAVEIGNTETFTVNRTQGFGEGLNSPATFVTVGWVVSNLSNAGAVFSTLTASGNSATFGVTFADDETLITAYTFDLEVTETCNADAPSYCAAMITSKTVNLQIQALGHDFNFSTANRSSETSQGNRSDTNTFIPLYFNSNQATKANVTSFGFQAVNMKSGANLPVTTADFIISNFLYKSASQSVAGTSVSVGGVTMATPTAGTTDTATLTVDGTLTVNDTFVITMTAVNSAQATPETTSITLAFIALEAAAPTITQSSILETSTSLVFAWPDGVSRAVFPVRTNATISAIFSETVTGPKVSLNNGANPVLMGGSGTSFTHPVTSGWLQARLGTGATTSVIANFSDAMDQNNTVKKNTLVEPAMTTFTFVGTPAVTDVTGTGTHPIARNGSVTINLSEAATGALSTVRAGLSIPNFGDYSLSYGTGSNSVVLSPLPGRPLIASGTSATVGIGAGAIFNAGNYPNIAGQSFTGITFAADNQPPLLAAQSVQGDDFRTAVTYVLTFNEALSGNVTVNAVNLTSGTSASFQVAPSANTVTITTAGLSFDTEYQFVVTGVSDGTNSVTVYLEPFLTLANDSQTQAEVAAVNAAKASDNQAPTVQDISPDFRLVKNQDNQPLRPQIVIGFSELMANSTTNSVILSNTQGASFGVALNVDSFDGINLAVIPATDLKEGTWYWVSFNTNTNTTNAAVDASDNANALQATTFKFKTHEVVAGQADTNTAPEFFGNNLGSVISRDTRPRFYFSEPVDPGSMDQAVTFWNASSQVVNGSWALEGSDALFVTDQIVGGGSYTYTIWTSRVMDQLGKADVNGAMYTDSFRVRGDGAIRDFRVNVSGSGLSLSVTASWRPPVDRSGITSYTVTSQLLDSDFAVTGSASTLAGSNSTAAAKLSVSGNVTGFSAGQSYRFSISSVGTVTSAQVDVLAIPDSSAVTSTLISILSRESVTVGGTSTNQKVQVIIKPGDLKESTEVTVSFSTDANLKGKKGGGERFSDVAQFGPDGLEFSKPVEIGLKIEVATPQTLANIASSCATLNSTCEEDLLSALNPLVYDVASATWSRESLSKSRVETVDANNAIFFARTPHFSSFVVAKAFNIVTADSTQLSTATIGQTDYMATIQLSGLVSSQTVDVSFSPNNFGFDFSLTEPGTNLATDTIYITSSDVRRAAGETATSVTVTVRATDTANNNSTDINTYTIPILDLNGNDQFTGNPRGVDSFQVRLDSTGTIATLSWDISSDTTREIDMVVVGYRNKSTSETAFTTVAYGRGVSTANITVTTDNYHWKIWTMSAATPAERSLESTDIERYTQGFGTTAIIVGGGAINLSSSGKSITVTGTGSTFFATGLNDFVGLSVAGGILATTDILTVSGRGPLEFIAGSLMDLSNQSANSSANPISVTFTVTGTGSLSVYHYDPVSEIWEILSTTDGGGNYGVVTDQGGSNYNVLIVVRTGSPFVVGPTLSAPVVVRRSGGGCLAVAVEDSDLNPLDGILNLLVMLLPIGVLLIRRFR